MHSVRAGSCERAPGYVLIMKVAMQHEMRKEPKKTALFVDFDNIYLGLRDTSREAAELFATRPAVWLRWIEDGMPIGEADEAPRKNRVLIRQCYLNPNSFGKYRGYFTNAGFSVVDCPSLTSRGKNSSDIVMVMDILDALRHETRFDRFVIMSADADFTPVLQRLRAHDRGTAVMVSGQAAPAYRASCDKLITEDVFIEHALELAPAPEAVRAPATAPQPSATAIRDPELLAAIGRRIYEEASSSGMLPASELPRILREFKEFTPTSNWLGYYSLQALTEAVLEYQPELRITDDDPWRIAVQGADEPAATPAAAADAPPPAAAAEPDWEAVRDQVVGLVARMVAESAEPVVMGKAAQTAIQEVGPRLTETRWLGKGTFKNLLLSARELPFRVVASPLPGYVFDPARHQAPSDRASVDGLAELGAEMASLVRRISQLTDAPKLLPRQYRMMWEVIAKELGRAPYSLMGTGKAVRDQCVERGEPIARQAITWVLRGLGYVGYHFEAPAHRPEDLAAAYRGNLLTILRQAQVTLTDDELRMLDEWLLASPADAAPPTDAAKTSGAPVTPDARPAAPRSRRAAPADPDAATEPDYAAWADALLAEASRGPRTPIAPEPDAQTVDTHSGDASADARPSGPAGEPEPFEWPPRDALLFEPTERPWLREGSPHPEPGTLFADSPPAAGENDDVTQGSGEAADAEPPAPGGNGGDTPTSAHGPSDDSLPSTSQMQPNDLTTPPDDQSAPPAIEADAQPADDAATPAAASAEPQPAVDAPPAEADPGADPHQPKIVSADWEMANDAASSAGADVHPAVEATHDGDAPPADIVPGEWQMAEDTPPAHVEPTEPVSDAVPSESPPPAAENPVDGRIVTADWQPADETPPTADADPPAQPEAPPSAAPPVEQPAEGEIVTAQWQPADETPATAEADQPAQPDTPSEPPRAEQPADGEVVNAAWQPEGAAAASDEPAPSAEATPAPSAAWEPVSEPPTAPNPAAPADATESASAPEPADGVVTPQWEPVTNGTAPDGQQTSTDTPPEPAAQMDAFPPDPPRDGAQPNPPEQVPAEISTASDDAPPPPQERQ